MITMLNDEKLKNSNSSQQLKNICSFKKHLHLGLLFEIIMKIKT